MMYSLPLFVCLSVFQGGGSYLLASYSAKICLEHYRAASLSRQRAVDNATT